MSGVAGSTTRRVIALDIETTGLDPRPRTSGEDRRGDQICEIGMVEVLMRTPSQLYSNIASGALPHAFARVISGDDQISLLERNDFVLKMHQESGLYDEMLSGKIQRTMRMTEYDAIDWLRGTLDIGVAAEMKDKPIILGSSVHFDRDFLNVYMPGLSNFFHYRHIDVSSIKELAAQWFPTSINNMPDFTESQTSGPQHRVLADIQHTLAELEYYGINIFRTTGRR